jgi:flavodoxin
VHLQPIGWWLAAHVHEGKEELNFSEFKKYSRERAAHKLEEIGEVTEDGSMPLKAYTLFHEGAELTDADKKAIFAWLKQISND